MLKPETLEFIIEKMRGDSLTPLGTSKTSDPAGREVIDILTNVSDDLEDDEIIEDKLRKWFALRKPFLRGSWNVISSNVGMTYPRSYTLEPGKLNPLLHYFIHIKEGSDFISVVFEVQDNKLGGPKIRVSLLSLMLGRSHGGKGRKIAIIETNAYLSDIFGIVR